MDFNTLPTSLTGEEIVITGISGAFPSSENVLNFKENLYNKVDMVTDNVQTFNHPEVPKYSGRIDGIRKFDAQFFRVHYKQANIMDPMTRKLLEHAYGAIYDAGINPVHLKGKKVGVFIGAAFADAEKAVYKQIPQHGFAITGNVKCMHSNRISYWMDAKGPSYSVDMSCASSAACVEHAYRSINSGQCEAAIVGGCNLSLSSLLSISLSRAGFLCMDGKTKCFDKNGDGYVRSDAINVFLLQKAKHAKRIYCEIYFTKMIYGLKDNNEFLPTRSVQNITEFLEGVYSEIKVSPEEVEYVEANACGIAEADGNELEAIGQVFAKKNTIKVGSVKSNMGHSEATSGVCSLTKLCLAYQEGKIPANLHYNEPQDHIPAVSEGKIQVVQEHLPFNRGLAAINTFSYGGANVHILLKGHYKPKDNKKYETNLPYLVLISSRQEPGVIKILDALEQQPVDPELIGLLHNIHLHDISGHVFRGYSILMNNEEKETICLSRSNEYYPGIKRQVWFVYSGMGSQWTGMGAELMRIPYFATAIERCNKVLSPMGIDIKRIITGKDETTFDNILNSFVGIAAVQIGLTDVLTEMGIVPDNIIGHSVGELGCSYADGCLTAEEMILSAYYRGLVSIQTSFIRGSMAAIGLGYADVALLCPAEIDVACHNSNESSTISGPAEKVKEFITDLQSRNIFAKEVLCSNIAYHSRYIAKAGPSLLNNLREVIKTPKMRSKKWVSTSVPIDKWDNTIAKYCSAEYLTNNLLNPVLFEETSVLIPQNALVIEIAPHGLLQAILKRSHNSCLHVPLTRKNHENPVKFFFESIGKLYEAGLNPEISVLYPKIQYPVSTATNLLSHFVDWEHSEDWNDAEYQVSERYTTTTRNVIVSPYDEEYAYLNGYIRNGKKVLPESTMIMLIWETLAMTQGVNYKSMSVTFRNIQFHDQVIITKDVSSRLSISVSNGNGDFQVSCDGSTIMTGSIFKSESTDHKNVHLFRNSGADEKFSVESRDIYRLLYHKGYSYNERFQSIQRTNRKCNEAYMKWNDDWLAFLDGLLQLNVLSRDNTGVSIPKLVGTLKICVKKQAQYILNTGTLLAKVSNDIDFTKCGGVEIENICFTDLRQIVNDNYTLQTKVFTPHHNSRFFDVNTVFQIILQIVNENSFCDGMKILEITENNITTLLNKTETILGEYVTAILDVNTCKIEKTNFHNFIEKKTNLIKNHNLLIIYNLLGDIEKMDRICKILSKNEYILTIEEGINYKDQENTFFTVIAAYNLGNQNYILLRKKEISEHINYISVLNTGFASLLETIKKCEKSQRVVLVSENNNYCSSVGLVRNLMEMYSSKISFFIIDDCNAPTFDPKNAIFKNQIEKCLTLNIFKQGHWGGYYYVPCLSSATPQNIKLSSTGPGDLENLIWFDDKCISLNNSTVQVYYAGLSKKDIEIAMDEEVNCRKMEFGMDFSGINVSNKKVMGLIKGGAISNVITADESLLWPVPDHWSLEDAATVPLPYVLAYYCLIIRGGLQKGNRVFVSRGLGNLGQAVISVCLAYNCEVYTTVSSLQKKKLLLTLFPKLKENNVISCNRLFCDEVIFQTKGLRCHLVISSFTGALREAAMQCVGPRGKFIDLSNLDIQDNKPFGFYFLWQEKSNVNVDLSQIFTPENIKERQTIHLLLTTGIIQGYVKPLARVVFSPDEISRSFKFLSNCSSTGRILIKMIDIVNLAINILPRISYSSKGSFVVFCDDGDLGIELVDRLIKQGARNLLIHTDIAISEEYLHIRTSSWRRKGATVRIILANNEQEVDIEKTLNEAVKLGPVLGIYYIQRVGLNEISLYEANKEIFLKSSKTIMYLANLDLISRNMCPELNEFVVISKTSKTICDDYVASELETICRSRNEIQLPALYFQTTLYDEFDKFWNDEPKIKSHQKIIYVLNALETSLSLQHNNVIAIPQKKDDKNKNFLLKVSNVLGIKDIGVIPDNVKFGDLAIVESAVVQIKSLIKDHYNIYRTVDAVLKMTMSDLKTLAHSVSAMKTDFDKGFGTFCSYVEEDECMGYEPVVPMPTILSNADENENELYQESAYLMLIPGFDGHRQIFNNICERLKIHAMTFQIVPNLLEESIPQIAQDIFKIMKKRFELKSKFYIMGYSFGVNVALELAALLEKSGYTGVVYCLDSSPDALRVQLNAYLGNLTHTEIENEILVHMYKLMTKSSNDDLRKDLETIDCWSDKVLTCVKRLKGLVEYSQEYQRAMLETIYRRIILCLNYRPNFVLESQLVLMKGIPHPNAAKLPIDYNLSNYSKQPVKVFDLETDHACAPYDQSVPNVINKFLDPSILEEFERKNLCETYVMEKKMLNL